MKTLFVTGTGTDIGKTFVTAGLIRFLRARGIGARALKPVMSGFDPASAATSDAGSLLSAMGDSIDQNNIDSISPWRFAAPLSPDMAAWREDRRLNIECVRTFCHAAIASTAGPLLIEGAGGLMTPLTDDATCLELVRMLGCPSLLVAGSYLGAISHALTAVEAMASRGVPLAAIIVNETPDASVDPAETVAALRRFLPDVRIVALSRAAPVVDAFVAIAQACELID